MKTRPSLSRRHFLRSASAGIAAPLILPGLGRGADSPNGKLNHAAIGVDGQGWSDLVQIASHPQCEIVAICDVDTARMEKAAAKFPQARRYQDWRELLEKEGDKIDSVNVTVPDHMHAPISISAMNLGKHCYTEKPLTHEVYEARQMRLAADKSGVVTQMGNQIHSSIEYRSAAIMVQEGAIGKVKEVHAWSGAKFPQRGRPEGEDPVPATLDWDKWIGVAPMRPYKSGVYHPFNWRGWIDFGGGAIGDFGCHILDTPFKALELTAPTTIKATVPDDWADKAAWHTENWPDWEIFEYSFPGTKFTAADTLKVVWYDGGKQPPLELVPFEKEGRQLPSGGSLFVGETGTLLLPHVGGPQLVPYSKNRDLKRPKLDGMNHYHNFVDGCLGKAKTGSHFGFAGPLTEATLLGNIANRFAGKELAWDSAALKFTNEDAANQLIRREYRKGWEVAGL
ncbi:MAG: Gfo/Idh/MocA family oxidoreductase [Verrucomicrobiales bacterium]